MNDRSAVNSNGMVDVVIVTFQSADWIERCVNSVLSQVGVGRIVVVDNGSSDTTASVVHAFGDRVTFVPLGTNRGFGAAANRGIAATATDVVLLLNPDLLLDDGAIGNLRTALENPALGLAGPEVRNMDGTMYPSARSFPNLIGSAGHGFLGLFWASNPWSQKYLRPGRVDWISGTAMMIRRTAFERIGGFDESYFMYVEDVDLCWRLRECGFAVALVDDASVRHAIGGSTKSAPYRMIVAHHRSLWRFAARTTTGAKRLSLPVVALGLVARAALVSGKHLVTKRPPAANH
jgi:N-acetylglucosaminyl-diphospho-decaprenol L-rhamnosyltransferase